MRINNIIKYIFFLKAVVVSIAQKDYCLVALMEMYGSLDFSKQPTLDSSVFSVIL